MNPRRLAASHGGGEAARIVSGMMRRLDRLIGLLLAFPMAALAVLLLDTLMQRDPLITLPRRILLETLTLGSLPSALAAGRLPTLNEVMAWTLPQQMVAALTVGLIWIAGSGAILLVVRRSMALSARTRLGLIAALLLVVGGVLTAALRPLPASATLRVDAGQVLGLMPGHALGFSQGGEGRMTQVGYFEQTIAPLQTLGARVVRIDHLYDYYNVLSFAPDGTAIYRWAELDRIVDSILAAGAQPLMTLSYTPSALAGTTVYAAPIDLDAWAELVYQTVVYYNQMRGLDIRYWEVWNEPNNGAAFWQSSLDEYLNLYRVTALAVKRADPAALVGGPGVFYDAMRPAHFTPARAWVVALAEFAQQQRLPLDFVSWHLYSTRPADYAESVALHRAWASAYSPLPHLLLTEWNWSGASSPAMDDGRTIAYVAAVVGTLADSPLEQAFFFEPIDGHSDPQGGWGMIRADGTTKPIYESFRLLSLLRGERIEAHSDHPEVGVLGSREDGNIVVLVWHYGATHPELHIDLQVAGLNAACPLTGEVLRVDAAASAEADRQWGTIPITQTSAGACSAALDLPVDSIYELRLR
ncbi:MAG: hypothetical protein IPK19_28645 [Chloroflexi bacterium]|nr:hypothetical protein [Chloroflexota bacterium]